jgi:hypothetical protein
MVREASECENLALESPQVILACSYVFEYFDRNSPPKLDLLPSVNSREGAAADLFQM